LLKVSDSNLQPFILTRVESSHSLKGSRESSHHNIAPQRYWSRIIERSWLDSRNYCFFKQYVNTLRYSATTRVVDIFSWRALINVFKAVATKIVSWDIAALSCAIWFSLRSLKMVV